MADRISTLDSGYTTGALSVYPEAIDSKETLYEVKNDAETTLSHSLTYNGKYVVVADTSAFPSQGLINIDQEIIYYGNKTSNIFKELVRGFAGSIRGQHELGVSVKQSVNAEPHNAIKDAIINIETHIGTSVDPTATSINGILKEQEKKWLAPKAKFRAFPKKGSSPLEIKFQNFSSGDIIRTLWDFGDGATSAEQSPTHTYSSDGSFTVQLTVFTTLGAEGIAIKKDYIQIDSSKPKPFMYVNPQAGSTSTTFTFVDQTNGNIIARYWIFDDGDRETIDDPNIHTIEHTYTEVGEYNPLLVIAFADNTTLKVTLNDPIIII